MSDLSNEQNEKLVFRKPPDAPQGMKSNQTKVSFIESKTDAIPVRNIRNSETSQDAGQPENDRPEESGSKIRRMSDSTRAKEAEKSRKNLRKGKNNYAHAGSEKNYTYQKERPDGDYSDNRDYDPAQNPDSRKSRKRRKFSRQNDVTAIASETLHLDLRDIVPVAVQNPEPVRPVDVKPAPRAEQTSLNLSASSQGTTSADDLDVTIRKTPEEAEEENIRRQKISAMMRLENTAEIQSDIKELRSAIFFRTMALMLVALISGYLSVRSCFHLPWLDSIPENLIALMQFLLGLAAGSVCMPTLRNGFTRLIRFRADTDSLAAIALGACLLDAFLEIFSVNSPLIAHYFMPCAVLILIFHTMGKLLIIDREETNLKEAAKRYDCYGLQIIEDEQKAESLARGILHDFPIVASMRKTDSLKDFRRYTYSADLADHFCHYAAPAIFVFSLIASIAMAIFRQGGISYAVSLFSMFSVACGCAAITFVTNLPLFNATRDLSRSGALLLGYQSVDDFYDTNSLMLDAASMFPMGSIQLQGIKMYSNVRSDEILLAAASLARYAGSAFSHIFDEVLHERSADFYPVENYIYEDSLGLCGWIHNQRVLLGNRELMISHRIEGVPSKSKESEMTGEDKEVIYLSISGNLSALFLVELHADKIVKSWVKQAMRHNMCLILHSVDPIITLYRISSLFEIPQDMIKIIPSKMRSMYLSETVPVKELSASLACTNDFSNMAQLIIATKIVRRASVTGVFVQAVTVLLGLALVLMEALLHLGINSGWMIILQCITVILTLLCVNIKKLY
ncbi:MAG: hypothetical protein K2H82_03160 [Oscillospiraceae bacterium]|nr:hypothetical protein [Oscillospiraceae bacterium]